MFGESQTVGLIDKRCWNTKLWPNRDAVSQLGTNTKAIVNDSIASYLYHIAQLNVSFIQMPT